MKKKENGLLSKLSIDDLKEFLLEYCEDVEPNLRREFKVGEDVNSKGVKERIVTLNIIGKNGEIQWEPYVAISDDYLCLANNAGIDTHMKMLDEFFKFIMKNLGYKFVLEYHDHYRRRLENSAMKTKRDVLNFTDRAADNGICDEDKFLGDLLDSIRNQLDEAVDRMCGSMKAKLDELYKEVVNTDVFGF